MVTLMVMMMTRVQTEETRVGDRFVPLRRPPSVNVSFVYGTPVLKRALG